MRSARQGGAWSALSWLGFPLVPALLGSTYHQTLNVSFGGAGGPDPRDWGWLAWVILTGPLLGYGFLAGATLDLPEDPGRRGLKGWLGSRPVWVGIGPWIGFLIWAILFYSVSAAVSAVASAYPASRDWAGPNLSGWTETWAGWLLGRALEIAAIGSLAYGWLFVAFRALRRARRLGRYRRTIVRGLAAALGFVGSLIGSFWAITEAWRGYFFDSRVVPILLAASCVTLMAGCGGTVTYGEVRRRELFQALLMAWLLGLALAWRWWSRPRSKPPDSPEG